MEHYLLIGAGFTRNWGGPLSEEITGSLLGELQDEPELIAALRKGPFEEVFQGFPPSSAGAVDERLLRFQGAVVALFSRLNKSLVSKSFEFSNEVASSVQQFLGRFDAIFSLNQDLLLEIHYMQTFISQGKWSGVTIPGMESIPPPSDSGPADLTRWKWCPAASGAQAGRGQQPLFKLHGSSNWLTETGEPLLIMGNAKAGAIHTFPILRVYHDQFGAKLGSGDAKLMVIGYSFQDEHINEVIERSSREHSLGTYLVDPRGRDALVDPKMAKAAIRPRRKIEDIKLIGELRRPLAEVFRGDDFAHGELMRFFG